MAKRRKKSKKTKSMVARKRVRKSSRKAAPRKTRRRRKAAAPKKTRNRKKSRAPRRQRHGKKRPHVTRQAGKYLVALLLGGKSALVYFGGTINRKPYVGGRSNALIFGNLSAAKDIARQLIRLRVVKKVGVFKASDSPASISSEMAAPAKVRKSKKRKKH